jgi:hypothetical protein
MTSCFPAKSNLYFANSLATVSVNLTYKDSRYSKFQIYISTTEVAPKNPSKPKALCNIL